jgi:hypothetical protein
MPTTTKLPSARPATPPSAPPPPWLAGPSADPAADPPEGGAWDAASADEELAAGEPAAELDRGSDEPRPLGVEVARVGFREDWVRVVVGFVLGRWLGLVLAVRVGFGSLGVRVELGVDVDVGVGVGVGEGVAASCGQMTSARMFGGGVFPPSCHTHPSVEPGFGLWVPAPSVA